MIGNFDYYDKQYIDNELSKLGYCLKYNEALESTMNFSFGKKEAGSLLVLTDHQTNGRGRYGNCWNDEKNKSVLMTIVEKNSAVNKLSAGLLSQLGAILVCMVLKKWTTEEIKIKWPNDIMLSGKKIAGIIIERKENSTRIGIGINVYEGLEGAYLLKKEMPLGRQVIVLDVMKSWYKLKMEMESGLFKNKLSHYKKLWQNNSFILNKKIMMSLKNSVVIGVVRENLLGGNVIVESDSNVVSVSEKDYIPGSCIVVGLDQ